MGPMAYNPPWLLRNGLLMTIYTASWASRHWQRTTTVVEPFYQEKIFVGAGGASRSLSASAKAERRAVPIFGLVAIPENAHSTIIATYGITGSLENQWNMQLLGRKAFARGYGVVLFDWRAHGRTAQLSATLTSDGLYEGEDFVRIAAQAKAMGCPAPFWFTSFSLGGQLALWAVKAGQTLATWGPDIGIKESEIGGSAVICPNLDSNRSLSYLVQDPWGKYLEKTIARELKKLAWQIHAAHPESIDPEAIARVNTVWGFDRELVIERLGFGSVEEYYQASSPLYLLPHLQKPTLILYAADDPMFDPTIVPDLQAACAGNRAIELVLTSHGGHVGYISSIPCQRQAQDPDCWWAWNRVLDWCQSKVKFLRPAAVH
ncbi:MAG: alpha/beta fold hydrolase [Hormoscilla sp. GUM202]|nr:alpha/beta fold hydrolase [Hormoscilla sp. GUM202]